MVTAEPGRPTLSSRASPTSPPLHTARRCARVLGIDPSLITALPGASGSNFSAGEHILRMGIDLDREIAAMSAAATVVPVPRVLDRARLDDVDVVVLERLPGHPAGELSGVAPDRAGEIGRVCGALHRRLASVRAPAGLPQLDGPVGPIGDDSPRVLHLDLHPFNVLVDEAGEVTGVIDWANAAAGDPVLDQARTWSILTLDPSVRRRDHPAWVHLRDDWITEGRLDALPRQARAWAAGFMLRDLRDRHTDAELTPVHQALEQARTPTAD